MARADIDDLDEFIDFYNNLDPVIERIPKRYIRDFQNPFEMFRENEFIKRYRFSKNCVQINILPLVNADLEKHSARGLPVAPVIQLLVFLRFISTGNFQVVSGDLRGVSQATVSLIIKRVAQSVARQTRNFIKMPAINEMQQNIQRFYRIAHFPGVVACIDCTHIEIASPGGDNAQVFRNRKGYFSLNVQVVGGPEMNILDIVVSNPGSAHDSVIFDRSALKIRFEQNQVPGHLLGDNGYPCRKYLLTPVINPGNPNEARYNTAHISTCNIVERLFGVWKRRFPCLRRTLGTKLATTMNIICACAVLHNLGLIYNNVDFEEEEFEEDMPEVRVAPNNPLGLLFRREFINQHFGN